MSRTRGLGGVSCLMAVASLFVAGCSDMSPNGFGDPITIYRKSCAELRASDLTWFLNGFSTADVLNPDERNQSQLTVVLRVGQLKVLNLVGSSNFATESDCTAKASSVQWVVSNTVVAHLEVGATALSATLEALQPGDVSVSAIVSFQDGTSPIQVLPYAFANYASGPVTVVRVVP